MLRVFIPGARRKCQRINYTRRRTGNRLLDTGSTPVYSIEKVPLLRHFLFFVLHFMLPQPNIRNDLQERLSLLTVIYPNLLKKSTKLSIIHGSNEEKCGIISKEFYKGVIDKL